MPHFSFYISEYHQRESNYSTVSEITWPSCKFSSCQTQGEGDTCGRALPFIYLLLARSKSIVMQQRQTEVLTLKQVTALPKSMKSSSTVLSYGLCEAPL